MEQMKITEMEALINRNYKNICGMNVLKTVCPCMSILSGMYFRKQNACIP